ncbi:putative ubiquitin-conjugating enzyme E2Q2-like protein [Trachypithecus francoisi]|uniref:putative ubiquitin-conjugating enzyme E2Q2-like protein n=1 Tax=Trachypithecus francoisi TaxID=54180 RepID=UPI00141AAA31|nr:putative ubiquitin-conjugating enzyme E2Q2-like protein [Trachypithecus francoisi]
MGRTERCWVQGRRGQPGASARSGLVYPPKRFVFKEKLTMKMDSMMEEKLECSLWCCLSDPSLRGLAARCCVLERRIVPQMRQVRVLYRCSDLFLSGFCISCFSPVECAPDLHPLTLPNSSLQV